MSRELGALARPKLLRELALDARLLLASFSDRFVLNRVRPLLPELFRDTQTLCLFIGYPRSGHSLVGSVIDAHPNAVVAHRVNAAAQLARGLAVEDVLFLTYQNALRFSRSGRQLTGYEYRIPGCAQGTHDLLRVVGDQEGRGTTEALSRNPQL